LPGKLKTDKMGNIGFTEILLVLLVVVLIFGGRKIPELMKGIGQGMKEFKKASRLDDEPEKKEKSDIEKTEEKK
jgi:sec-independent protein translocase protein TatA